MDESTEETLRSRIRELELIETAYRNQSALIVAIMDSLPLKFFAKDDHGRFVLVNRAVCNLVGKTREELLGKTDYELFPLEIAERLRADDAEVRARGGMLVREELVSRPDEDQPRYFKAWKTLSQLDTGDRVLIGFSVDITEQKRVEQELRDKVAVIEEQRRAIEQREAPVIRVWEGILVMPLTGVMSVERGAELAERMLHAVVRERARVILLDLTGVPAAGRETAEALVRIAEAARLLGAHSMLAGMSPDVARSLVDAGADLSRIDAVQSLEQGLRRALGGMTRKQRVE